MSNTPIFWPEFRFGPINLWVLPSADWFYRERKLRTQEPVLRPRKRSRNIVNEIQQLIEGR